MTDQEFAAVLARARQGDREAMARIIAEYEPQVRMVARRRMGPALRAMFESADLVQSVHRSLLLSLRRNKFTFDGPEELIALAVTMVKRKAAKKWERRQREQEILQLRARMLEKADPERVAELAGKLQDILESLSSDDCKLLKLYLEGRSGVEAARILECDPDSLRVRRHRLFRKLRATGLQLD
jgi:RNA polymerase sigma-70 factor (ECF subfamily)